MWESLVQGFKGFFGVDDHTPHAMPTPEQIAAAQAVQRAAHHAEEALAAQHQADVEAVANDAMVDLVGSANHIAATQLNRFPVKRRTLQGDIPAVMPVASVTLGGVDMLDGMAMNRTTGSSQNQVIQLNVRLHDAVGNHDIDSLNNAIHAWLGSIPSLQGHLDLAMDVKEERKPATEIWNNDLKPLVLASGKFTATEMGYFDAFFEQHGASQWGGGDHIRVEQADDKVQIQFRCTRVKGEEENAISGESHVRDYLNQHKASIIENFKEKVSALGVLTPEEIAAIDSDIHIKEDKMGGSLTLEFGTRSADGTLGATPLTKLDRQVLDKAFTEAFLESGNELPPVFNRIADGGMIGEILTKRLGQSEVLTAALEHEYFETSESWQAKKTQKETQNLVKVGNALEGTDPHVLQLKFPLPLGVTLDTVRNEIVGSQHQMQVNQQKAVAELTQGLAA